MVVRSHPFSDSNLEFEISEHSNRYKECNIAIPKLPDLHVIQSTAGFNWTARIKEHTFSISGENFFYMYQAKKGGQGKVDANKIRLSCAQPLCFAFKYRVKFLFKVNEIYL